MVSVFQVIATRCLREASHNKGVSDVLRLALVRYEACGFCSGIANTSIQGS